MPYWVVVDRDQPSFYRYLKRHMEEPGEVAVVMDRRFGERRRRTEMTATDTRRRDRRVPFNLRELPVMPGAGFRIFPAASPLPT